MCDPMTIAGLALSAAGTVAHGAAQSRVRRAQDARSAAESDRQRRLSDEASAAFQRSLANQGRESQDATQEDKTAKREETYQQQVSEVDPSREYIPGTGDAPKAVRQTIIDSLSDAEAAGRNEAAAKARLEGFGDLLLDSAIFRGRRGQEIGQIGGFARGSSGVLPLELEAAKSKGRGLGLLGDLLTGAGMVTGVAGAAGVGPQNWGDITSWFSKSPKLVNTGLGNLQGVRLPGASGFAAM